MNLSCWWSLAQSSIQTLYYVIAALSAGSASMYYIKYQSDKKKKYTIDVIKNYQSAVESKAYNLDHNTNNCYINARKAADNNIATVLADYANVNKSNILNCMKHPKNPEKFKKIEDANIYNNIFESLERISLYVSQNMVNKKIIRDEISPSFMDIMESHYNTVVKYSEQNLSFKFCQRIYSKWFQYYN